MSKETYEVDITTELFQKASLMSIHFGSWSGQRAQNKGDEEAQHANVDQKIYKKGQKKLVNPDTLKPFANWRTQVTKYMERHATRFYLRGVWLVSHDVLPEVKEWLVQTRASIMEDAQIFLSNYETHRAEQIALFNATYPEKAGTFDADYPTVADLEKKFRLNWVTGNWNMAQLDEAAAGEREEFRQKTRDYLEELSKDLRVSAAESCAEFLKALNVKSGEVNDKKIQKMKDFCAKFKSNNFLGDKQLDELMDSISNSTLNITTWTSDEILSSKIKERLEEIVELGKDEGAAAEVASSYVRRVSTHAVVDDDIELSTSESTVRRIAAPAEQVDEFEQEAPAAEVKLESPEPAATV
jgi:Protein of unknown function (DUF3150)